MKITDFDWPIGTTWLVDVIRGFPEVSICLVPYRHILDVLLYKENYWERGPDYDYENKDGSAGEKRASTFYRGKHGFTLHFKLDYTDL